MTTMPKVPFSNETFSLDGGGLDFLGLRLVNLRILQEHLIPGVNNATADFGVYCLATWIPWKFRQLCGNDKSRFNADEFRAFEERVSVAIAHSIRADSDATEKYGPVSRGIGVQQKLELPAELSFNSIARTRSTSIYAAPLYGPTIGFLNLVSYAQATDLSATEIRVANDDDDTAIITEYVEESLSKSASYSKLNTLSSSSFDEDDIDDLAINGLHTSFYRQAPNSVHTAFAKKLLPDDMPNGRTLTSQLLQETLIQSPNLDLEQIRSVWHTGLLLNGSKLSLAAVEVDRHRRTWAVFQGRQYQRYVLELFLKCFEQALLDGNTSISAIVESTIQSLPSDFKSKTIRELLEAELIDLDGEGNLADCDSRWCDAVHPDHKLYVFRFWEEPNDKLPDSEKAIRMLCRWWIRAGAWLKWESCTDLLADGGESRIGVQWFHTWIENRLESELPLFLSQLLEQTIFAQHLRIALSRFDGENQRLRFILDDRGIVPTSSARASLTQQIPGWTADRLFTFCCLLCDIGLLQEENGEYRITN